MAKNKKGKKLKGLWAEFKAFINKGNALMLAVGVVLGSGFTAIVTSVTNILLNLVTSAVPGGLSGLVTPIYTDKAIASAEAAGLADKMVLTAAEFLEQDAAIRTLYTNYGGTYYFNGLPVLNWGAVINSIISFIFIAIILFVVVKIANYISKKNAEIQAKALEAYYQKHPEERPAPPVPEEPKPTELDVLNEIRDLLKEKK